MLRITDTSQFINEAFNEGSFDIIKWKEYADKHIPGIKDMCLKDLDECLEAGYSWRDDFLPVLNGVILNPEKKVETVSSFHSVTDGLEDKIRKTYGRAPDADTILYLGLCNGAGWATEVNSRRTVLLGMEKIIELDWCSIEDMEALILHELGHIYHFGFAKTHRDFRSAEEEFLWQLFSEGVAMVFEQDIIADKDFYHQDKDGWKKWCEENITHLAESFENALPYMNHDNQNFFGDWVSFEGHGDTGYYLGTQYVRHLLKDRDFNELINMDIEEIKETFTEYVKVLKRRKIR